MDELKAKYVGRFYGPNKIVDITPHEYKLPSGDMVFELSYDSGLKRRTTEKALALFVTGEISDLTSVRQKQFDLLVPVVSRMMVEHDLMLDDVVPFCKELGSNLDMNIRRADSFLWTHDDREYAPGAAGYGNATLLNASMVIDSIPSASTEKLTDDQG